ncbi:MAG: hypothetical protein P8R54_07230 [Myxococcota bacterium]|nr:hypothetical protein [Myxococcota bacterium]
MAVRELTIGGGRTRGVCEVLLVYSAEERALLTRINRDAEQQNVREPYRAAPNQPQKTA